MDMDKDVAARLVKGRIERTLLEQVFDLMIIDQVMIAYICSCIFK